eukprot:2958108-Alexandrium_andersonii.AAC.1
MECIKLFHVLRERLHRVGAANCGLWKSMKANTTAGANVSVMPESHGARRTKKMKMSERSIIVSGSAVEVTEVAE